MSRKTYLLLLSFFITVNAANAGVADQNARLKLLIERAKARKAGAITPSTTTTTTTTTISTPAKTVIINHDPSPPVVPIPVPIKEISTPTPPKFERKPRIIETHPKVLVEPIKEEAPVLTPQAPIKKPITTIQSKTTVIQPPVSTLTVPSFSSVQTKSTTQTSISPIKPIPSLILKEDAVTQPTNSTEFKTEPNATNPSYNDVLKSIDEILQGQKAEEQASQKPKTQSIELNDKALPRSEVKEATNKNTSLINTGTTFAPQDPTAKPTTNTSDAASKLLNTDISSTSNITTDKDADYLLVLRKSLKSLEEDSWAKVKLNMGESLDYFAKEKKLYPKNLKLNTYYKVILGFQRFSEGGLELDEGDFADFEDAEALYLDTQDLLEEAQKELGNDYNGEQVKGIVGTVLKYTEEELQYIEEVLGM